MKKLECGLALTANDLESLINMHARLILLEICHYRKSPIVAFLIESLKSMIIVVAFADWGH